MSLHVLLLVRGVREIGEHGSISRTVSHNRTLKEQIIHGRIYWNLEQLRDAVRGFVERYNADWLVEKNGYLSPNQAHQAWNDAISLKAAA